ncbi:hypothetical protein AAHA92_31266 [Salvia divinorum]|uniref:Uncharacterized protein n=1 Tax=Salvia divinorum TaxID=28513 RepID=A0ABD1FWG3_SALDI
MPSFCCRFCVVLPPIPPKLPVSIFSRIPFPSSISKVQVQIPRIPLLNFGKLKCNGRLWKMSRRPRTMESVYWFLSNCFSLLHVKDRQESANYNVQE